MVTGHGPNGIRKNAPRKVIGIPTITQPATFMRRNRDRMRNTSTAPCHMFSIIIISRPLR